MPERITFIASRDWAKAVSRRAVGIIITEQHLDTRGQASPSDIRFEFRVLTDPEIHGFPITTPTLAFIAHPTSESVLIHENSILPFMGGHIGLVAHYGLDELTSELVEGHLLAVARKVLQGTGAS